MLILCVLLSSVAAYASTTFDLMLERFPNRYPETETVEETTGEVTTAAPEETTTAVRETEEMKEGTTEDGSETEETLLPSEPISGDVSEESDAAETQTPSETTTEEETTTTPEEMTTTVEETTTSGYNVVYDPTPWLAKPSGENYLKPFVSYLKEQFGEDAHVKPGAITVTLGNASSDKPHYLLACSVITPGAGSVNASTSAVVLLCDLYNKLRLQENLNVSYSLAFTFDSKVIEESPYILSLTKEDYDGVILFDNLLSCERLCLYKCNTDKEDPFYLALRAAFLNNGTPLFEVPDLAYAMGFKEPLRTASLPIVMIESAMILSQDADGKLQHLDKNTCFTRLFQSDDPTYDKSSGQISGTVYDKKEQLQKNISEFYPVHAKNISESLLRVSPREAMPVKEKPTLAPTSAPEEGPTFFAPTTEEETTTKEETTAAPTTESVKEENSGMPFTRSFLFFVLLLFAVFAIAMYLFRIRFVLLRRRKTKFDEEEDTEDTKSK